MMNNRYRLKIDFLPDLDFSQILTNPILDIAARFWEDDRYEAFKTCYRSMRILDDLVDDRKVTGKKITEDEIDQYARTMTDWLEKLKISNAVDSFEQNLIDTIDKFKIPLWPWEKLIDAMSYDLRHNSFPTFTTYLRYTEGAAIAPASVFTHLCGIVKKENSYSPPSYDIRIAARPLAIFSYIVHIIRDFQKDQLHNLNYFADNLLKKYNLKTDNLREIARGGEIKSSFRSLMRTYKGFAEYYRKKARQALDVLYENLQPRYQLSLDVIYSLYLQIFERIDPENGNFTEKELNPGEDEVYKRIQATVTSFRAKN